MAAYPSTAIAWYTAGSISCCIWDLVWGGWLQHIFVVLVYVVLFWVGLLNFEKDEMLKCALVVQHV